MKEQLVVQYEKRKDDFVLEKKQAGRALDELTKQITVIENEMNPCVQTIQKEKDNIAFQEKHPTFKSAIEIKLSHASIKQQQEALRNFGFIVMSLQNKIDSVIANFEQAEKGLSLCESCIKQLNALDETKNASILQELHQLLQST